MIKLKIIEGSEFITGLSTDIERQFNEFFSNKDVEIVKVDYERIATPDLYDKNAEWTIFVYYKEIKQKIN